MKTAETSFHQVYFRLWGAHPSNEFVALHMKLIKQWEEDFCALLSRGLQKETIQALFLFLVENSIFIPDDHEGKNNQEFKAIAAVISIWLSCLEHGTITLPELIVLLNFFHSRADITLPWTNGRIHCTIYQKHLSVAQLEKVVPSEMQKSAEYEQAVWLLNIILNAHHGYWPHSLNQ